MIDPHQTLAGRSCQLDLSRPCIMGVLNVTPDSFFDGGRYADSCAVVDQALTMEQEGAGILDIGGESTRPGSLPVPLDEELERVIPVIEGVRCRTSLPISIDTNKSKVAAAALSAGANFVNDISGLRFDSEMAKVVAESGAGLFVMHTSGRPEVMQQQTEYRDLIGDVVKSLQGSIDIALSAGIEKSHLAVDPGIGFGKTVEGNLELLNHLDRLHQLGYPVLLGTSRKSFIGAILELDDPYERLFGTLATVAAGVGQGAQIFRVHDVRPAREVALVSWAIREQRLP